MVIKVARSAITGMFVSYKFAKKHPKTTVFETIKMKKRKKKKVKNVKK